MTNVKTTKRALLTSVVALVMCFTMLLGTTFAWFTDSVTSENNIIKSGNLDVTLEYYDGKWNDVKDASDILTGELWEPGYVDVAYFRIKNAGSLALKYQFGVNIVSEDTGKNVDGEELKLSDYIYFDVFENVDGETAPFADRAAALKNTTETTLISAGYTKPGTLEKDTEYVYLAMVVYMPESVGNKANHDGKNKPSISLGISIVATQLDAEKDSFGPDYDAGLEPGAAYVSTAQDLISAFETSKSIVLMEDITLTSAVAVDNDISLDLNGKTLTTLGLSFDGEVYIKNGVIKSGGATNMTPHIKVGSGSLTMDEVSVQIDDYLNYFAQGNRDYAEYTGIEVANCTAVFNNCDIYVKSDVYHTWNYAYAVMMNNADVTINGGSITAESAGAQSTDLKSAVSAIGNCTATLNNVTVNAETVGTTMGHLILNTTDASVTDSDFASFGGTYELNIIAP